MTNFPSSAVLVLHMTNKQSFVRGEVLFWSGRKGGGENLSLPLSLSLSHTHTHTHTQTNTHTHTIHKLIFFNFFFIQHFAVNFSEKRKITKNFPHSFSSTLFLVQYVLHKRRELHTWYIRTLTFCVTTTAVSLVHLHYLGYTRTWILKSSIQLNQTHMLSIHSSFVQSLHTCSVLTLWLKVTRGTGA